jgi:hypothetical protein
VENFNSLIHLSSGRLIRSFNNSVWAKETTIHFKGYATRWLWSVDHQIHTAMHFKGSATRWLWSVDHRIHVVVWIRWSTDCNQHFVGPSNPYSMIYSGVFYPFWFECLGTTILTRLYVWIGWKGFLQWKFTMPTNGWQYHIRQVFSPVKIWRRSWVSIPHIHV